MAESKLIKVDGTETILKENIKENINLAKELIGCEEIDYMIFNKFTLLWDDEGRINGSRRNFAAEKLIAADPKNNKFEVFGDVIVIPNDCRRN